MEGGFDYFRHNEKSMTGNGEADQPFGTTYWADIDSFCHEYGFYQDQTAEVTRIPIAHRHQEPPFSPSPPLCLEGLDFGDIQTRFMSYGDIQDDIDFSFSLSSPNIIGNCPTGPNNGNINISIEATPAGPLRLSAHQIMRVAGERFIQSASHEQVNVLTDLSIDDRQDVELVQVLLTAAEKVSEEQYEKAGKLLINCGRLASNRGTPVQRAVFYFVAALKERIEKKTGQKLTERTELLLEENTLSSKTKLNWAILSWIQRLPFHQAMHFAGVQAMLECVATKSKVHVIDFFMRTGMLWAVLMEAVARREACPIEYIRITAVETNNDRQSLETIGKHLESFGRTLNLHVIFNVISVSDFLEQRLDINPEETSMVFAPYALRRLIGRPNCMEKFMKLINRINPSLMVVFETEANHNAPSFVNRFIEALFYYGTIFDCLDDSMEHDHESRTALEAGPFCYGIRNVVAAEGRERTTRSVNFEVWKAFFARFGMVEVELSESSLYQANLVAQSFPSGNFCTLETIKNCGNCLIVGWKGTPLFSLSVWKFVHTIH